MQDKIVFHPERLSVNYKFSFKNEFEEINLKAKDGNILNGLLFKIDKPKGVILFFHSNTGNIVHWGVSSKFLNNLGYDVLMMDYRGYGKTPGNFIEKLIYSDSQQWYDYLKLHYNESLITVYGRGIGAPFATYLSTFNKPIRLVLETPLYNYFTVARNLYPYLIFVRLISKYKLDTAKYIKKVTCKIYIVHGKMNKVVHYKNSVKLYNMVKDKAELLLLEEGNNFNLQNHDVYLNRIKEILKN